MPLFCVPHYHVLGRDGYAVWTYVSERDTRLCADARYQAGQRPIILTCRYPGCQIYDISTPDSMSEEKIHARIDQVRVA